MVSGRRGCAGLGGESCWVLDTPSAGGERAERPSGRQGGEGGGRGGKRREVVLTVQRNWSVATESS